MSLDELVKKRDLRMFLTHLALRAKDRCLREAGSDFKPYAAYTLQNGSYALELSDLHGELNVTATQLRRASWTSRFLDGNPHFRFGNALNRWVHYTLESAQTNAYHIAGVHSFTTKLRVVPRWYEAERPPTGFRRWRENRLWEVLSGTSDLLETPTAAFTPGLAQSTFGQEVLDTESSCVTRAPDRFYEHRKWRIRGIPRVRIRRNTETYF